MDVLKYNHYIIIHIFKVNNYTPLKRSVTVHIKEPCQEDWSKMTPTQKGAFCSACNKEVIDFTYKTDHQIFEAINNSKDVCGRFFKHQTERPIAPSRTVSPYYTIKHFVASFVSFIAFYRAYANGPDEASVSPKDSVQQIDSINEHKITDTIVQRPKPLQLSGTVMSYLDNSPLISASIKLVGTGITVNTDSTGFFCIDTTLSGFNTMSPFKIVVQCKGYKGKYLTQDSANDLRSIFLLPENLDDSGKITWKINDIYVTGAMGQPPQNDPEADIPPKKVKDSQGPVLDAEKKSPGRDKPLPALAERMPAWIASRRKSIYKWLGG